MVTLNFLIPRVQPGDPAEIMVQKLAGKNAQLDQAQVQAMRDLLGTPTGSLWSQYWQYLGQLLHGNFGLSYNYYPFKVTEVIGQAFWWTVILVTIVQVLSFVHRRPARRLRRLAAQRQVRHRSPPWSRPSSARCNRSGSPCC